MKTVLLVDDDRKNLAKLSGTLLSMGYLVIAKSDGRSALQLVQSGALIDCVIADYRMPYMDGFKLLMALRRVAPALPVILMLASGTTEGYLRMISVGIFEHIAKPVKRAELERMLGAVLGGPINVESCALA